MGGGGGGGDNCFLENIRKTAFNERIINQLGNRWQENIKTIFKEECWFLGPKYDLMRDSLNLQT